MFPKFHFWRYNWSGHFACNQRVGSDAKVTEFGDIMQNNGYYAVQGHSRSRNLVPIESPYTTFY